jgi:hypothetical protein
LWIDRAQRIVLRLFRLQRLGAQGRGRGAGGREGADVHRRAAGDDVDRGGGEVLLLQGRRPEAARERAAQGEAVGEVIARRDLAGRGRAEVRIVLVAGGQVDIELVGDLVVQVDIEAGGVAADVDLVGRAEAGEALGAGALAVAAVDPRGGLAGLDLVGLVAVLDPKARVLGLAKLNSSSGRLTSIAATVWPYCIEPSLKRVGEAAPSEAFSELIVPYSTLLLP